MDKRIVITLHYECASRCYAGDKMHSSINKLTLDESLKRIAELNPDFLSIADMLPLSDKHALFVARYPYGIEWLRDGTIYLPDSSGQCVPLGSESMSASVTEAFSDTLFYPPYLCSHGHVEVSFDYPKENMSVSILTPGKLTGLNDIDDTFSSMIPHAWNWHSGVKTTALFFSHDQDEITQKICQELGLSLDEIVREGYIDFSRIAKRLAEEKLYKADEWYSEVLLFPMSWYEHNESLAWVPFYTKIKRMIYDRSRLWRFRWIWDGLLSRLANGNDSQLTIAFVKHLMSVACGSLTSFSEATESDLPCRSFKEFFGSLFGDKYQYSLYCAKGFNCQQPRQQRFAPLLPNMLLDFIDFDMLNDSMNDEKKRIENLLHRFFSHLKDVDLLRGTPLNMINQHVEFIFDDNQNNIFNKNYVILRSK